MEYQNESEKRKWNSRQFLVVTWVLCLLCLNGSSVFGQKEKSQRSDKGMFVAETVKSGMSFKSLAEKYYGNQDFWIYIYLANKSDIPNPSGLRAGMSVVIPQAQALGIDANNPSSLEKARSLAKEVRSRDAKPMADRPASSSFTANGENVTETVQAGETFRTLALNHYGDKEFWVYIYLANKAANPDPNKLNAGKKVVIPSANSLSIDSKNPESLTKAKQLAHKTLHGNK